MTTLTDSPGRLLRSTLADVARIARLSGTEVCERQMARRYEVLSSEMPRRKGGTNLTFLDFRSLPLDSAPLADEMLQTVALSSEHTTQLRDFQYSLYLSGLPPLDVAQLLHEILHEKALDLATARYRVFAEIAPVFAFYLDSVGLAQTYSEPELDTFESRLRPGPTQEGGQSCLRQAFRAYHLGGFAPNEIAEAQYTLLANCQVALHEQLRLQPNIRAALAAPIDSLFQEAATERVGRAQRQAMKSAVAEHLIPLLQRAAASWRQLASAHSKRSLLPLSLAELPEIAEELREIQNPELETFLRRYDLPIDSESLDWTNLQVRMAAIVKLFRTHQKRELSTIGSPVGEYAYLDAMS